MTNVHFVQSGAVVQKRLRWRACPIMLELIWFVQSGEADLLCAAAIHAKGAQTKHWTVWHILNPDLWIQSIGVMSYFILYDSICKPKPLNVGIT